MLGARVRARRGELPGEEVAPKDAKDAGERGDETLARFTVHDGGTRGDGVDQSFKLMNNGEAQAKLASYVEISNQL